MTSGTIFEQRRIIKAKVKFSDNSEEKIRPVVILSNYKFNNAHNDIICFPITSEIRGKGIKIVNDKLFLEAGRIPLDSEVKSQYPLVLSKNLCIEPETYAKVTPSVASQIITDLKEILISQ